MYYGDSPGVDLQALRGKRRRSLWPLVVPLACAAVWLVPIAALFGAHVALYCAVVAIAGIAGVALLALLPVAEGLDRLGVGH